MNALVEIRSFSADPLKIYVVISSRVSHPKIFCCFLLADESSHWVSCLERSFSSREIQSLVLIAIYVSPRKWTIRQNQIELKMFTSSFDRRLGFSSFFFSLDWDRRTVRLGDLFDDWPGRISWLLRVSSPSRVGDFDACFLCLEDDEWSDFFFRLCDEWE